MLLPVVLSLFAPVAPQSTGIAVGQWNFASDAFADDAHQIGPGGIVLHCGASSLVDALTGYSPEKQIVNIGYSSLANHFQVDFIDRPAINGSGPDIVFFESRYSADPYEIAVRPQGGSFTSFLAYPAAAFLATGEGGCPSPPSLLHGLELELDDFGFSAGAIVDAIQFRALPSGPIPEGDPVMVGVLEGIGRSYCDSSPNSTGAVARISAKGSLSVAVNQLVLRAEPVPDEPFLFLYGSLPAQIPFGNGTSCVGGNLTRFLPGGVAAGGVAVQTIDLLSNGIPPFTPLYLQCWFRDPAAGAAGYNASDGLVIIFWL